jgi:hypothetical protein
MRRWVAAVAAAAAMAAFPIAAGADAGSGESAHLGPFATVADPDGGSCGASWALDKFDRFLTVHDNGDGTFEVREDFKNGAFVTTGPSSPGGCEAGTHHGTAVVPGIEGTFQGYLEGTVSGGTFNPAGCAASGANCTTTTGLIDATFGSGAAFTCLSGAPATCRFAFEYAAGDQGLIFHHWEDRNDKTSAEEFRGDIATS